MNSASLEKRHSLVSVEEDREREELKLHRLKADAVLNGKPFRVFKGHTKHVIDLAWSKGNFLLSASMDKTVRLWHTTRPECLSKFLHSSVVTSVAFHPKKDGYCLTGCFDKKLRVWYIPDGRVVKWALAPCPITAAAYNVKGDMVVAGLYDGQCFFYMEKRMRYYTQIECRNRSGRNKKGKKVTGLQFSSAGTELLVTTNDSRLRYIRMDDFSTMWKYKGLLNTERGMIAASLDESNECFIFFSNSSFFFVRNFVPNDFFLKYFSKMHEHIICGSQTSNIYLWRTKNESSYSKYSLLKREYRGKNYSYETFSAFDENEVLSDTTVLGISTAVSEEDFEKEKEEETSKVAATVAIFMPPTAISRVRPPGHPSYLEMSFLRDAWKSSANELPNDIRKKCSICSNSFNLDNVTRQIIVVSSSKGEIKCFENIGPPVANHH